MIGKPLLAKLKAAGHPVRTLGTYSSNNQMGQNVFQWAPDDYKFTTKAVEGIDCIIHLAGANVGNTRWNETGKKAILQSRVNTGKALYQTCLQAGTFPKKLLLASGTGYYADPSSELMTEGSAMGKGFLADVCMQWEAIASDFRNQGTAVSVVRTGPVLAAGSGLLKAYLMTLPFHVLPVTGGPNQIISWIELRDIVAVYEFLLQYPQSDGIWNAVAPNPVTQSALLHEVAAATNRKCIYPGVPAFLLKLAMGERAALPLSDQNVSSAKLIQHGFVFQSGDIQIAMHHIFNEPI